MTPEQRGESRRSLLRRGVLLGAGTVAAGTGLVTLTGTPAGAEPGAPGAGSALTRAAGLKRATVASGQQNGWRYCAKCKGLWYGGDGGTAPCAAGGNHATLGLSGDYILFHDFPPDPFSQNGWKFCRKCRGLAFGAVIGVCPAPGRGHDYRDSYDYAPWTTQQGNWQQGGWKHCKNCQAIHYAPVIGQSRCPRTGGPHIVVGSADYWLDL